MSNGFILDEFGNSSRQSDILVFDALHCAPLYRDEAFVVASPDMVTCVLEVKSNLTKAELVGSLDNIASAKRLNGRVQGIVFAFLGMTAQTLEKHLAALLVGRDPAFLPDKIYIASRDMVVSKVCQQKHSLEAYHAKGKVFATLIQGMLNTLSVANLTPYLKAVGLGHQPIFVV